MDPSSDAAAIRISDLVKHYRSGDGGVVRAVDGISFDVKLGETVGLLGANGAGKTTTLRMIATLVRPTSGSVRVAGHDAVSSPLGVRCNIGYLSASTGVPDRLTPREVIHAHGRLHGLESNEIDEAVDRVVGILDLAPFAGRPCGRLSSGQRQRVSLGRALVHDPPVIVLDEPTSALDIIAARELMEFLDRLREEGHAILISTHHLHEIERRCDRFVILHDGRVAAAGTLDEITGGLEGGLEEAYFAAVAP